MSIRIKNPHSVLATLHARPKAVKELVLPSGGAFAVQDKSSAWSEVAKLAQQLGIRIQSGSAGPRAQSPGGKSARSNEPQPQGRTSVAEALIEEKSPVSAEELFQNSGPDDRGVWLALDCLTDPQNIGAIFRSAAFFGVRGILLTEERSAPMSSTVYDISAGGVEAIPHTMQTNLQRALEIAKDRGLWVLGTSEHEAGELQMKGALSAPLSKIRGDRPWLVIVGNEEKGLRRLTLESCDQLCRIVPAPSQASPNGTAVGVTSLNVSVATAILLSHLRETTSK